MKIAVKSMSPVGIDLVNKSVDPRSDFLEVDSFERLSLAEGVRDHNKIISTSDICITYVHIDSDRDIDFSISVDSPVIKMSFFMSSPTLFRGDRLAYELLYEENTHNVFYFPEMRYEKTWLEGKGREFFAVNLSSNYIQKYFPEDSPFVPFIQAIEEAKPAVLSGTKLIITTQMRHIIKELLSGQHDNSLRKLHIEAKVFELLLLQLAQYSHLLKKEHRFYLDNKLQESIMYAKELLDKNFPQPYKLVDLAQEVGTNAYYLKKGFKDIFGQTILGYVTACRMEHARELLEIGWGNVNEVAFLLGYNDATNFTAAFKKYHGLTPSQLFRK